MLIIICVPNTRVILLLRFLLKPLHVFDILDGGFEKNLRFSRRRKVKNNEEIEQQLCTSIQLKAKCRRK